MRSSRKAVEKAEINKQVGIAKNLLQTSLTDEQIAKYIDLTVEQVKQLRNEIK